jgi:predicted nucleic acid-binding Zn ribbon protein
MEAAMFFRKTRVVVCAVCGKPINPGERRFADKNRVTKAERHTHVTCRKAEG